MSVLIYNIRSFLTCSLLYKCIHNQYISVSLWYKSMQEAPLWGRLSVHRPQVHSYSPDTSAPWQTRSASFYGKMEQNCLQMSGQPTPSSPVLHLQDWGHLVVKPGLLCVNILQSGAKEPRLGVTTRYLSGPTQSQRQPHGAIANLTGTMAAELLKIFTAMNGNVVFDVPQMMLVHFSIKLW